MKIIITDLSDANHWTHTKKTGKSKRNIHKTQHKNLFPKTPSILRLLRPPETPSKIENLNFTKILPTRKEGGA